MSQKRNFILAGLFGAAFALSGCSSSKTASTDSDLELGDEVPVAEASTDAVPAGDDLDAPPPADQAQAVPAEDLPPPAEPTPETPPPSDPLAEAPTPPADAPAPEPAPDMAATAPTGPTTEHKVRRGDTLMKIAFEVYGDIYQWRKIYDLNRDTISDPNNIPKGIVLKVEQSSNPGSTEGSGEKYKIKQGDTLGKISKELYGTEGRWKDLYENNRQLIKDPNKIFAGFFLYYQPQGAPMASTSAPADPAAAPMDARMPAAADPAQVPAAQ